MNNTNILYYLYTHLNLFTSKSLHPDLNSKPGLIEKAPVAFIFLTADAEKSMISNPFVLFVRFVRLSRSVRLSHFVLFVRSVRFVRLIASFAQFAKVASFADH